jgi:hypothetical protein
VDLDEINISVAGYENISLVNSGEEIYVSVVNSTISSGYINLSANDSQDVTYQRINFNFSKPRFGSLALANLNGNSTNLSALSNFTNVLLVLEKNTTGKITFGAVNFTQGEIEFGSQINISDKKIFVNSSAIPMLNVPAHLMFYNISYSYPVVFRDGAICSSQCSGIIFDSSTKIFELDVLGFSTYEIREASCGDGLCNGAESCSSCSSDCGVCSTNSPSTGGGGGTSSIRIVSQNISSVVNVSNISNETKTNLTEILEKKEQEVKRKINIFAVEAIVLFLVVVFFAHRRRHHRKLVKKNGNKILSGRRRKN